LRLHERDKILFHACITALKNKNQEKATLCANELSEVRKLINFLGQVQLALERVILRLETIKELNELMLDLRPALNALRQVSNQLTNVMPDVASELEHVNESIQDTLAVTRLTNTEPILVTKKTTEGEKILKEVSAFLEEKITRELPEPPTSLNAAQEDTIVAVPTVERNMKEMIALSASCSSVVCNNTEEGETDQSKACFAYKDMELKRLSLKIQQSTSIEDMILEYVKKRKGEIDITRCASELNLSYKEIEKALENLDAQGKIKFVMP
jgi:division protein CdvB (Snf7/Vps24/ESCRT-III family)/predicted CopG family antitoxin